MGPTPTTMSANSYSHDFHEPGHFILQGFISLFTTFSPLSSQIARQNHQSTLACGGGKINLFDIGTTGIRFLINYVPVDWLLEARLCSGDC